MNSQHLTRRHFLAALAASVVAAGAALPIGFPKKVVQPNMIAAEKWIAVQFTGMPGLFRYTGDDDWIAQVEVRHAA